MKAYHEPKYDSISQVSTGKIHKVCYGKYNTPKTPPKSYNSSHFRCNVIVTNSIGTRENNTAMPPVSPNVTPERANTLSKSAKKFKQDKAKCKLKTADISQKYKDKIIQKARNNNMSINKQPFQATSRSQPTP